MQMNHPTDAGRTKNVPDALVEKYLAGGWTEADVPESSPAPKKRAAKKAAASPSDDA